MARSKVPKLKLILCGEYGVGKSSLFRRYTNDTFCTATDRQSTLGLDHFDKKYSINGRQIIIELWDTCGMERIASITSSYYKHAEAAIIVCSSDNSTSLDSLGQQVLDIITNAEFAKIFLCRNKTDLEDGNILKDMESYTDLLCYEYHGIISGTYKTCCKTGEGVHEMFQDIAHQLFEANQSRINLQTMTPDSFKVLPPDDSSNPSCSC